MEQPELTWKANETSKRLVLHLQIRCGSLSITTPVSLLANEFDVQSVRASELGSRHSHFVFHEVIMFAKILRFIKGLL